MNYGFNAPLILSKCFKIITETFSTARLVAKELSKEEVLSAMVQGYEILDSKFKFDGTLDEVIKTLIIPAVYEIAIHENKEDN